MALLLLPLAVASVGRALVYPSLLALVSSAATPEDRGLVMGAFQSSASLARVFGPLTAGVLYDVAAALPVPAGCRIDGPGLRYRQPDRGAPMT